MKKVFLISVCALCFTLALSGQALATKPKAPAKKASKVVPKAQWMKIITKLDKTEAQAKDFKGELVLVLINKAGKKRQRRAIFFQKGTTKRLMQFKYPASFAGLTVLIRGASMHLYLPQFRKVKKIAAHVKNQPFMGTDLSFDDMGALSYRPYYRVVKVIKLDKGYRLTLKPKPGVSKPYSKLVIRVRPDGFLKKVAFFNKAGKKIKTMKRSNFKKIGKWTFPCLVEVHDLLSNHRTQVIMRKIQIATGISNRIFKKRYLKRTLSL